MVVTMLDEVAWLFNMRGSDIEFNPGVYAFAYNVDRMAQSPNVHLVFFGYAVITHESALLFVNPNQVDEEARVQLGDQVQVKPYDTFLEYLRELPSALNLSKDNVIGCPHPVQLIYIYVFRQPILLGDKSSLAIAEAVGTVSLLR
jgi:Xaa-Pro aminopeptidase